MTSQPERVVVITGGSRGIGRALCLSMAEPGTRLYFNYASGSDAAGETERLVKEAGGFARGIQVNVASEKEVADFFKTIIDEAGQVDVLVNNAGITGDGLLVRMKESDWDKVMDINLKGTFNCMKIAAKAMMKKRYGRIINMTSVVGVSGNPGQANYVASKAGVIGLTKSVAKELATRNITVNAVAPGYIETDMTKGLGDKAKAAMIGQIPMARAGSPEDISGVVKFLASDAASYITGQVIHVSGGMYM